MKYAVAAVVAVLLVGGAFYGGTVYATAGGQPGPAGAPAVNGAMGVGPGGPVADLTEEEQAELDGMTDEERRQFFQDKMAESGMPAGGEGMRGPGGGGIEGTVLEVVDGTVTIELAAGGSRTVYIDEDTIVAKADGASNVAEGSEVLVLATPEADGVTSATAIVVK